MNMVAPDGGNPFRLAHLSEVRTNSLVSVALGARFPPGHSTSGWLALEGVEALARVLDSKPS